MHYLVIIDDFSRFLVAKAVIQPTTAKTILVVKEIWLAQFGAPEAVLVDRGAVFTLNLFQQYIRDELAASLIYSGAGYPQENALNESVHRGIEASLAASRQHDSMTHYSEALRDAVIAYNSTPHSATGVSPYFTLFCKHISLPGLQRFQQRLPNEKRLSHIYEARRQAMQRANLNADLELRLYKPPNLYVGDVVVYYLQQHERKSEVLSEGQSLTKYMPCWLLLVTILSRQAAAAAATVDLGNKKSTTIPRQLLRKLGVEVPPSLQPLLISAIDKRPARLRLKPIWAGAVEVSLNRSA